MKRDNRTLSVVRERSPFATPPRVLVMADEGNASDAVALLDALEEAGAVAEVRFAEDMSRDHSHPDAVIVAQPRGYRIARHHPVLEDVRLQMVK